MLKNPLEVCVTFASSSVAYALYVHLCSGQTWGPDQPICLRLFEVNQLSRQEAIQGVKMELEDSIHPLLMGVTCTADPAEAAKGADVVIMMTENMSEGQELTETLQSICAGLKGICTHIASAAKPDVKILVAGPLTNTSCLIVSELLPNLPKQNITGLSRLEYNRSVNCLSKKTDSPCESVRNVTLWGEVGRTGWPDATYCTIQGCPVRDVVMDDEWLDKTFVKTITERPLGSKGSFALSTAQAISDQLHDWFLGTPPGRHVPVTVESSRNTYSVTTGLFFSFPCTAMGGEWHIVDGFSVDDAAREKLMVTENNLCEAT